MTAPVTKAVVRTAMLSDDQELCGLVETMLALDPHVDVRTRGAAGGDVDVVVVDVGDGDLDGLQRLREIRRSRPNARLVAFSPLPDPVTFLAAIRAGADAYLSTAALWRELLPTIHALSSNRPVP